MTKSGRYPVMYVLHGLNQDETYLIGDGSSGFRIMLGNMINQGLAEEMIVVFPYIFASKTMDQCTGFDEQSFATYDNFVNVLVKDFPPHRILQVPTAECSRKASLSLHRIRMFL